MLIFNGDRHEMLRHLPQRMTVVELGVFKGKNAKILYELLNPKRMDLIDSWSAEMLRKGYPQNDRRTEGVRDLREFSSYFGGDPYEQSTFDAAYDEMVSLVGTLPNVNIVREDTHNSPSRYDDGFFDLIYIDANHQYEYVLRDLKLWESKVSQTGYIAMNDCVSSPGGRAQNFGVLEAVSAFLKAYDFVPVSLTMTDYSDLILTRRSNPNVASYLDKLIGTGRCVELPDHMISCFNIKSLGDGTQWVSFC